MADDNVKVLCRCRPLNTREKGLNCKTVVQMHQQTGMVELYRPDDEDEPPKQFTFDGAFGPDSCTRIIYDEVCFALVQNVIDGYNGTIFAYGQTGCGKSFSMEGIADDHDHRGITPRAFEHIFNHVSVQEDCKFLVRASYLEIYNENIRDLLGKDARVKLPLHEHPEKGVYVKDLSMNVVHSVSEMVELQAKGSKNRAVGATAMNADSSRSHSIFTVWIEVSQKGSDGQDHIRAGKLNLVDLAGSERQTKTQAEGDRLKEATKINLSLSALGNVISALVDGNAKHIPYRDSKLTRLLQDSLGGNTKTLMVACLSPADNNYDETLSTLRYANRAKNIKNKAKINEDPKDALLRQYQEEIEKLKALLAGQLQLDPSMLSALGLNGGASPAAAPPVAATPARKALPAPAQAPAPPAKRPSQQIEETLSAPELEKYAAQIRAEKDAELKRLEDQLKNDYDAQLAQLQEMYTQEKTTNEKLEEEFERITALYNQQQLDLHDRIKENQAQSNSEVIRAAEEEGTLVLPATMSAAVSESASSITVDSKPVSKTTSAVLESQPASQHSAVQRETASNQEAGTSDPAPAEVVPPPPPRYDHVIVTGPRGILMQALVGADCVPIRAVIAEDGSLQPKLNQFGNVMVIKGPDGQHAVPISTTLQSKVTILNVNNEPVIVVPSADGFVKATVTEKGKLDGALDEVGIPEFVEGKAVTLKVPTPLPSPPRTPPPPTQPSAVATAAATSQVPSAAALQLSPGTQLQDQAKTVEELRAKLMALQQNLVAGGAESKNTALKEEMKSKKKRAEQGLRDRLKEARAKGEEENVFGEIYDTLQDDMKAKDKRIAKLTQALKAAKREADDLQQEFEREREDMLETIRKQGKQLQLSNALLDKVRTLIRPNCNYYNLEKIRAEAVWDEEGGIWLLPKVILSDPQLPSENPLDATPRSGSTRHSANSRSLNLSQSTGLPSRREIDIEAQERAILDSDYAKQQAQNSFLSKLQQRENEIAEQLDSRLSRFELRASQPSARAQQLLHADPSLSLDRARKYGPPEPGGVSLGSPRSKRLNPLSRK